MSSRLVFFSHSWGVGEENHAICREITRELKNRGLDIWLDEERVGSQISDAIVQGIDESKAMLISVTRDYMRKVNSSDTTSSCLREFNYALDQKRFAGCFVCIITEEEALDMSTWTGTFKMKVHHPNYINLCASVRGNAREQNLTTLAQRLQDIISSTSSPPALRDPKSVTAITPPPITWGGNTKLTVQALRILLDLMEIPKPEETAQCVVVEDRNDCLKKLSALTEQDLLDLNLTRKNAAHIHTLVISRLCQRESFVGELRRSSTVARDVLAMTILARNAQEASEGFAAIQRLFALDDDQVSQTLLDLGAGEAMLSTMQRYAREDAKVAEHALAAMGSLPQGTNVFDDRLDVCKMVIEMMQDGWEESHGVSEQSAAAIYMLARESEANKRMLGELGACEALVLLLSRFGAEASVHMAFQICRAMQYLALENSANGTALLRAGACEAIAAAFKSLRKDEEDAANVAEQGCAAIRSILGNDAPKQEGACEAIALALARFGAEDMGVAIEACAATFILATNTENKLMLRALDVEPLLRQCPPNAWKQWALDEFK